MHKKIRLLYDADYEEDKFCLVQSLVLWSFWWKGTNNAKDSMHFLATAQSVARTIDLHKSGSDLSMNSALQSLRRRVWWSLVIRDTIGSFGLSRAPKIKDTDHGVPMLRLDDFDLQDQESEVSLPVFTQTGAQKRLFARICIEHARLVQIFCKILNEACPEGGAGRSAGLFTSQQMEGSNDMSSRSQLNIEYLNACEEELMSWRQTLPEELWHKGPLLFSPAEWDKAELALKGYLSMMFYTAVMTLHRPQMLTTAERTGQDLSRATVRYAAQEITAIGLDFFKADLVTTLSASCISCLIPASINHVFDMFSDNATIRSGASQRLDQCKFILQGFSEQQFAASWVVGTLDHILDRAQQKNKSILSSGPDGGVNAHSRSAMASNRGFESFVAANNLTPSAMSLSNTGSLAGVTLTNISGQSADSTSYPPNPDDRYWASLFGNQNGVGNAQLPYLLSGQGFSDEGSNIEALEEMWSDFVHVSETSVGSGWTNGNF